MTTNAAAHCRRLTRQLASRPASFRVRARPCACAPACIGNNWNCRVSARQCASVTPARGLPAVGHDVGTGRGQPGAAGGDTPSALAALGPTSPNRVGRGGSWVSGRGRGGLGTPGGGTGLQRPREQPPFPTEFVSRVRGTGNPEAGVVRPRAKDATWANVARRVANGRGRQPAVQPGLSAGSTGIQPLRPRVRRGMNGNTHAARSEA